LSHLLDIKRQAIKYLSYREHSAEELLQKLVRKFDNTPELYKALDELASEGLQSDLRYSVLYIESRSRKGYGRYYIENALKQKGVSRQNIIQGFNECTVDWQQIVRRSWQKKFSNKLPQDMPEKIKQVRFLLNRGFTSQEIKNIHTKLSDESF